MADLLFPPHACISAQRVDTISNTASARSVFTGATRTVDRGGDRFRWSITRSNASDRDGYAERAILKAFCAQMRGQANRAWFADPAYQQRGSFPAQELFGNNTFTSGTSGWTSSSAVSLSVQDRMLRATRLDGANTGRWRYSGGVNVTPYAPYAFRLFALAGRGSTRWGPRFGSVADVTDVASVETLTEPGMSVAVGVPWTATVYPSCVDAVTSRSAGDFILFPSSSFSRCALIDNGPNAFLHSDSFDNAAWTKTRSSIDPDGAPGPDGTSSADRIIEDSTASNSHFVLQSATVASSAADFSLTVALKAGTRTWAYLSLIENTGSTQASAYVNISTGALGTTAVGSNWSNLRTFVVPLGNDWYAVTIVSRKTNAATSVGMILGLATGDGSASYTGDGSSYIIAWRATLAQSSVPTRLVQTTSSASTGTSQSGIGIHVKGLPASTSGLLLPGDRVQIGNQLCEVVASLDSDAAGLGYLQLAWPLRSAPSDNDPVIINNPMARCVLTSNEGGWSDIPGGFSEFDFQLEEALD